MSLSSLDIMSEVSTLLHFSASDDFLNFIFCNTAVLSVSFYKQNMNDRVKQTDISNISIYIIVNTY